MLALWNPLAVFCHLAYCLWKQQHHLWALRILTYWRGTARESADLWREAGVVRGCRLVIVFTMKSERHSDNVHSSRICDIETLSSRMFRVCKLKMTQVRHQIAKLPKLLLLLDIVKTPETLMDSPLRRPIWHYTDFTKCPLYSARLFWEQTLVSHGLIKNRPT